MTIRARVYARMGRQSEARQILREVGGLIEAAGVLAALGDTDQVFRRLFRDLEECTDWHIFIKAAPPFGQGCFRPECRAPCHANRGSDRSRERGRPRQSTLRHRLGL